MKKTILILLAVSLFVAGSVWGTPPSVTTKAHHKDIACADCHGTAKGENPPASEACLSCHGPMNELIEKTSSFKRNPHRSPHWADTVPCYSCHKEHKKSELVCSTIYCHVSNFSNAKLK